MKPIAVGFAIPSLRGACEANPHRRSDASAAVQTVPVPFPVGTATLQLTGIHVRLQPPKTAGKPKKSTTANAAAAAPAASGVLTADIVVHAHVRGELNTAARSYVVAVVPVRYDTTSAALAGGVASASPVPASAAPYDKRVLNARAREARRGVMAPVAASAFAKVDLRTQLERVRLSFTVVPCGRLGAANGAAQVQHHHHSHAGGAAKRPREEAAPAAAGEAALVDCALEVTVVGTVSALV